MGLTGLEVVGKDGEGLPLDISMMAASPRDLNDLPEYGDDLRTLDKYGRRSTLFLVHWWPSKITNLDDWSWIFLFLICILCPLLRLIDGYNITTEDHHMWLIPFSFGEPHTLNVIFSRTQVIAGLRIWNYNKSPEDSYRGVRLSLSQQRIGVVVLIFNISPWSTSSFIFVPGEEYSYFHRWCRHLPTRGVPDQERTG